MPIQGKRYTKDIAIWMDMGNLERTAYPSLVDAAFDLAASCLAMPLSQEKPFKAWAFDRLAKSEVNGGALFEQSFGNTVSRVTTEQQQGKLRVLLGFSGLGSPGTKYWPNYCTVHD